MFDRESILKNRAVEPLMADFWLPDLQVMGARDQNGTSKGFFLGAKGGHNAESHNHNDVGSFVLYFDGSPVIIDAGVGDYTAKTFSAQRYDIWTMQSGYHNLPSINGVMQKPGRNYAAAGVKYAADGEKVNYALEIAGAYPEEAQVNSWVRNYAFARGKGVEISDKYQLKSFVAPSVLTFLSAVEPELIKNGLIGLPVNSGNTLKLVYKESAFEARVETVTDMDARLKANWGDKLYRIVLVSKSKGLKGSSVVEIVK